MSSKKSPDPVTILLVEDNEMVRSSTALCLETLEFKVLSAGNGLEALGVIDSGARIDLLLSDVIMPGGMTGQQLADEARSRIPDLRVLLISGYPRDELIADGRIGDDIHILTKPVRLPALATAIEAALRAPSDGVG